MRAKPISQLRANFRLSQAQKQDAREAYRRLAAAGLDWSLDDAARVASEALGRRSVVERRGLTTAEAVERFMASPDRQSARGQTREFYAYRLEKFCEAFPATLAEVTRADLLRYLASLSRGSAPGDWRAIRALLRWCVAQEPPLVAPDPSAGLKPEFFTRADQPIALLTLRDCAAILKNSPLRSRLGHGFGTGFPRYAAALALFAGLRPSEVAHSPGKPRGLHFEDINFTARTIRLPAEIAKARRTRIIEHAFPVLWKWLKGAPKSGPVYPHHPLQLTRILQLAAGFVVRVPDKHNPKRVRAWPADGPRHTWATYHIALYRLPGQTALDAGHEGRMELIWSTYAEAKTKAEAQLFADLSPENVATFRR